MQKMLDEASVQSVVTCLVYMVNEGGTTYDAYSVLSCHPNTNITHHCKMVSQNLEQYLERGMIGKLESPTRSVMLRFLEVKGWPP